MKKLILCSVAAVFMFCSYQTTASAAVVSNDSETSISASNQWDDLLDEFEKYVDQYIKVYKKAMAGDMSAMTEYVKLAEKAQKLSDQLAKAQGSMSASQTARYLKIVQKMSNVM